MASKVKVDTIENSSGDSEIKIDTIKDSSGTRTLASDSGSAWSWGSGVPSGTIVQTVQGFFDVPASVTASSTATSSPRISLLRRRSRPAPCSAILRPRVRRSSRVVRRRP